MTRKIRKQVFDIKFDSSKTTKQVMWTVWFNRKKRDKWIVEAIWIVKNSGVVKNSGFYKLKIVGGKKFGLWKDWVMWLWFDRKIRPNK